MTIDWTQFPTVAFIDSNVALECLALEQLPWREVHSAGPILVLIAPTVLREVDSKKNHARLGDHARRFNRNLRPLLRGHSSVVVRPSPAPRVEIALADCPRVDWDQYPDLDPDEPDARIVAEALCARGPAQHIRVVVGHDIRTLHLARQHGLKIHEIGDNWLRPKEISEADKRAANLQRELDAIKERQPELALSFTPNNASVDVLRIKQLSAEERIEIQQTIIRLNPMREQKQNHIEIYDPFNRRYDGTLSKRYARWKKEIIPRFVDAYERKLELNFGQVAIQFHIKNTGQVPAESLLIRLSATGGWLNDKYVVASPAGPSAPTPRFRSFDIAGPFEHLRSLAQPGKHEFVVIAPPERSAEVRIGCADFRHGYDYEYRAVGWADPHAEKFRVEAVVTAANLYGEATASLEIGKEVQEVSVQNLLDPKTLKFRQVPEIYDLLQRAPQEKVSSDFSFDGEGWDDQAP
jgi:hypothetical protein